jgi:hypothetical protein
MKTYRVKYKTKDGRTYTDTEVCDTLERAENLAVDLEKNDYIVEAWVE